MDYNCEYQKYRQIFENYLNNQLENLSGHTKLVDGMKYSFKAGGKRVRPVLMLAVADMLGGDINKVLPYAFSLECIHTYSLIHDDMPCMDNDDLRRNMPTNHKVFGEDFALLCGDALLNLAMEHSLGIAKDEKDILALRFMFECSGYRGMILGQAHDILPIIKDEREHLYITEINKTAKLISVALNIPAILFGGDSEKLIAFSENLGLIYQYVDDLLDEIGDQKTLGKAVKKDKDKNKLSATVIFGVEGLKNEINKLYENSKKILDEINGSEFLRLFLDYSVKRES